MDYLTFLDAKPLYYDVIDYTRMPRAWEAVRAQVVLPPVIHLVGTNGKGTTGRFLASALRHAGYRTGHYTSPHILRFNERIWIDGADADDAVLQAAFETVMQWLGPERAETLSYFEFTTLMAVAAFQGCDYIVMEAGLGGEHDATAVFEKRLSLFTPIDFDHQAFLGETLEAIATTKLRAMGSEAIIGLQPHAEVYAVADAVAQRKGSRLLRAETLLDEDGIIALRKCAQQLQLPQYLQQNLMLAMAALSRLGVPFGPESFGRPLFGRLSRIAPNIRLDVGHNVLAAEAIAKTLQGEKLILIYNSYGDKAYEAILRVLKPVVSEVQLIPLEHERAVAPEALTRALETLRIPYGPFEKIDDGHHYLVFGSFSVAEAFLRWRKGAAGKVHG